MLVDEILSEIKPANCAIPDNVINQLRLSRFVIWGTGKAARYAIEKCRMHSLKPSFVCDSFEHDEEEVIEGCQVVSYQSVLDKLNDYTVLICCSSEFQISKILESEGISYIEWDTTLMDNYSGVPLFELMKDSSDRIEMVYNLFADEKSRRTFECIFKYRLTLESKYINAVFDPNTYFGNDVVSKIEGGAFLDCGAYYGDTLNRFLENSCCNSDWYYALEPDPWSYGELVRFAEERGLSWPKFKPLPIAVWDKKTTLRFNNLGNGTSRIEENGGIRIQADRIDSIVEKNDFVSYIKMDVEGGEVPALIGATSTIQKDCPTLGISVYHKKNDLWDIPLLIYKLNPNYKLFLRHHSWQADETVCYAKV